MQDNNASPNTDILIGIIRQFEQEVLSWAVSKRSTPLAQFLRQFAQLYIETWEGVYDHSFNGEFMLLDRLSELPGMKDYDGWFIDVGALYGDWSLKVLNTFPKAKVLAVEMDHRAVSKLKENLSLYEERAAVEHAALIDHPEVEEVTYAAYDRPEISTLVLNYDYGRQPTVRKVKATTLAKLREKYNIQEVFYLKVDAEGSDYYVLRGDKQGIEEGVYNLIQFEYGPMCIPNRLFLLDFYRLLQRYAIGRLYFPEGVLFRPYVYDLETFMRGNYVAALASKPLLVQALSPSR